MDFEKPWQKERILTLLTGTTFLVGFAAPQFFMISFIFLTARYVMGRWNFLTSYTYEK